MEHVSPTFQIVKFDICLLLENLSTKIKFCWNLTTTITSTVHADRYIFLTISRSVLPRIRSVSGKCCRETQNTHFVFSNFFPKIGGLWDNVGKYGTAGQATDGDMAHAHFMLVNKGYTRTHTHRICNTCSFSTATMATRTRPTVTVQYIACLPLNCTVNWNEFWFSVFHFEFVWYF